MTDPRTPAEWSKVLREEWEARARSLHRDHFIAAIPNFADPKAWAAQARIDADLAMYGIPANVRGEIDLLDVGCGVGRLAALIAPTVRGYTGVDISPAMVAEAVRRCASASNARFLVSDGLSIPREALDREYDLAFALATFIHCPRDVCHALFRAVVDRLKRGGSLRGQVLADPKDEEGIDPASAANMQIIHEQIAAAEVDLADDERALIEGTNYAGHRFGFTELRSVLEQAGYTDLKLWRFDRCHMYFSGTRG